MDKWKGGGEGWGEGVEELLAQGDETPILPYPCLIIDSHNEQSIIRGKLQ